MIGRITALVQAPLATVRAAQRVADDAGAVSEALLGLARSVPAQLSAVTLRLGQIQADVTELPAIGRGIGALEAELAAVQRSLAALTVQVDAAVALLPDPDEPTGLIAKARDALTADAP